MNRIYCILLAGIVFIVQPVYAQSLPLGLSPDADKVDKVEVLKAHAAREKAHALLEADRKGWPKRGVVQEEVSYELMRLTDGRPHYYITNNVNAAISTAAHLVRDMAPFHVNGSGLIVGVWDGGGVRVTHQEFGAPSRVLVMDGAEIIDHATHVAGTIGGAGVEAGALGMAPEVLLYSYDWNDDAGEMLSRAATGPGQMDNLYVSNHSYGSLTGWAWGDWSGTTGYHWVGVWNEREDRKFGQYDEQAALWDLVCWAAPWYLPFKAAGNDRSDSAPEAGTEFYYFIDEDNWGAKSYNPATDPYDDGFKNGYNTVPTFSTAKNIMTVGAVRDAVTGGMRDISLADMTTFSGWGPTDDGRIKPDIVANGFGLYSARSLEDDAYGNKSGTSMAAPNATGSALLLVQYYQQCFPGKAMRASMLKGLIIHTADDLGAPGPDYRFGWGLMNAQAAADHIRRHRDHPAAVYMAVGRLTESMPVRAYAFTWNGVEPIRATLCWTDPPGQAQSGLNVATSTLAHDLDLWITGPGGEVVGLPFLLNPEQPDAAATRGNNTRDNVEQVLIEQPTEPGVYAVHVSHKSALQEAEQYYALLLSGQHPEAMPEEAALPAPRASILLFALGMTGMLCMLKSHRRAKRKTSNRWAPPVGPN